MTDQQKKQQKIAVSFSTFRSRCSPTGRSAERLYNDWLLTEEGKRLTAEEPEKESSYELLLKISKQLDRLDRLRGDLFRG
jgi:hypothetical protein